MPAQQRPAIALVENGAVVERIDDQAVPGIVSVEILLRADEEMPREVDALGPHTGAPRDLDVDEAERDGNARSSIQYFVEAAVSRIVVTIAIAGEAELGEQVFVERVDARYERCVVAEIRGDAPGRRVPHLFQPVEIRPRIEARILESGNEKGGRSQIRSRAVCRVRQLFAEGPRHTGHLRWPPRARSGWTGADSQSRSKASSVSVWRPATTSSACAVNSSCV